MMAEKEEPKELKLPEEEVVELKRVVSSYLGVSFSVFLALAPKNCIELQRRVRELSSRLWQAEEQVIQMRSRRKEDSKANARVVEIFASHRNAWQTEEKRLLQQIDAVNQELAHLNARIADFEKAEADSRARILHLEREVAERDEMISFMSARGGEVEFEEESGGAGCRNEWCGNEVKEGCGFERDVGLDGVNVNVLYEQRQCSNGIDSDFLSSSSKIWADRASLWQV